MIYNNEQLTKILKFNGKSDFDKKKTQKVHTYKYFSLRKKEKTTS